MKTSYFLLRQYVDNKDGFKCFFKGISVPPLSPYQESLIEQISELRSNGWNNPQIAKLFNEKGYLTPGGKIFTSTHVWSIMNYVANISTMTLFCIIYS